jgi:hypothetical protein
MREASLSHKDSPSDDTMTYARQQSLLKIQKSEENASNEIVLLIN